MNYLDCWFNGPPEHNILFYDGDKYIESAFEKSVKKTFPDIIIIYNLYTQNKQEIVTKYNLSKSKLIYNYYTVPPNDDLIDCGVLIFSSFPIIIYSNQKYPMNTNRVCRCLGLMIRNYEVKIDMDSNLKKDGYLFSVKFTPTNDEISHTNNKMKKIMILKRPV